MDYNQLSHYLSEKMWLDIRQNVFRKIHSTGTISLFEDLYNSLDTEKITTLPHIPSTTVSLNIQYFHPLSSLYILFHYKQL